MFSSLPSSVIDANSEFRGIPTRTLMGNAGKQSCKEILKKWKKPKKVQIFCGNGGNGGDGLALAVELLSSKIETEVVLANDVKNKDAKFYFRKLPKKIIKKNSNTIKFDGDILVDALLGVGVKGKLKNPFNTIVRQLKRTHGKIVSLDVPTGDLKPNLTIAFHSSKNSINETVFSIGVPKIAETHFGPGDVRYYFPKREQSSHKGKNGKVLIVGGSKEFVGAPIFAALGAIAGGADLVNLMVPQINFAATRKFSPNIIVHNFTKNSEILTPAAVPEILRVSKKTNSTIVIGCGLGQNPETQKAVIKIIDKTCQPLVIDADALIKNLSKKFDTKRKIVLTPHASEFRKIAGKFSPQELAKKAGVTILKKGAIDMISAADGQVRWNDSGNPILTVGGTGDTLAGLIGSLLSRGAEPFKAAGMAAFILGKTGEELALKSESITPQILARKIPQTIRQILNS